MSTWNRKELKEKAKLRLKANYWKAVLVGLITLLLGGAASSSYKFSSAGSSAEASGAAGSPVWGNIPHIPLAGIIAIGIFVVVFMLIAVAIGLLLKAMFFNPLEIGQDRFFHRNLEEKAEVKEVCYAFDRGYKNSVKVMFFRDLYTFLWTLLFIVPGIVKGYEYRMIPYILGENPNMEMREVFAMSKQMMNGNKWRAFVLDLSFILWEILGACTLGILNIFYVEPYRCLTCAGLYQALKEEQMHYHEPTMTDGQMYGSEPTLTEEQMYGSEPTMPEE